MSRVTNRHVLVITAIILAMAATMFNNAGLAAGCTFFVGAAVMESVSLLNKRQSAIIDEMEGRI